MKEPHQPVDWLPMMLHAMVGAVATPAFLMAVWTVGSKRLLLDPLSGTGLVILLGSAAIGAGLAALMGERLWDLAGKFFDAGRRPWSPLNEVNHSIRSRAVCWCVIGLGGLIIACAFLGLPEHG